MIPALDGVRPWLRNSLFESRTGLVGKYVRIYKVSRMMKREDLDCFLVCGGVRY